MRAKEVRAAARRAATRHLHRDRDEDGHRGEDEQPHLVAPAADDEPQLGPQEPRGQPPLGGRGRAGWPSATTGSAADIEALPGQ